MIRRSRRPSADVVRSWIGDTIVHLLPPGPERHRAVKTSGLQHLVARVDNDGYSHGGVWYRIEAKRIAPGLYRVWFVPRDEEEALKEGRLRHVSVQGKSGDA